MIIEEVEDMRRIKLYTGEEKGNETQSCNGSCNLEF